MATPLTSPDNAALALGVNPNDTAAQQLVSLYVVQATAAIGKWCRRDDFGLAAYTRVLSGNNAPELALPDLPVQGLTLAGTLAQSSATVTGLPTGSAPSARNLFVGQSVAGAGVPAGTTVADVSSAASGQITLSAAATAGGSAVPLAFGVAVYYDNNALGGSAPGAFDPRPAGAGGSLLQEGVDYWLSYTGGPGTTCEDGLLRRAGFYWFLPNAWMTGLVTPQTGPAIGNVKAVYLAGFLSVPPDVEQACLLLLAEMRQARRWGRNPASLGNSDMNVALPPPGPVDTGLFSAEVRQLLAGYVVSAVVGY